MKNLFSRMAGFIRTYKAFAKAGVSNAMAYRTSFICFTIGESLYCFVMYFIWKAVFMSSGDSNFMGFTMADMTVYVFLSNLVGFLTSTDSTDNLAEEIHDGSIIMRMIKPVNFDMYLLFHELGSRFVSIFIVLVPMSVGVELYKFFVTGSVMFSLPNFALFSVSIILAYLVSFYFNVCYGFLAFFLKNLWGSSVLKDAIISFLSGAKIPLAFMPPALAAVLTVLPFASLSYTPVMLYMGIYDAPQIIWSLSLQLFWLVFFWGLSKLIWRLAMKRLCVQGG